MNRQEEIAAALEAKLGSYPPAIPEIVEATLREREDSLMFNANIEADLAWMDSNNGGCTYAVSMEAALAAFQRVMRDGYPQ